MTTLPFAKLRHEGRPRKFACNKNFKYSCNILDLLIFSFPFVRGLAAENPDGFIATFYKPDYGVGYVIIANLLLHFLHFFCYQKNFCHSNLNSIQAVWTTMMIYSLPLMIAGFGGMINETFDRIMLAWLAPVQTINDAKDPGCHLFGLL